MENLAYLFAAYSAVWIVLFAYVVRLQRHIHYLEKELEMLGRKRAR
jgi:CcmD family protein